MPKVSIIVPVYNAEKYLEKCINCILEQTFTDWELILVDDGSIDKSSQICDSYLSRDCRIKVYHQTNRGVSSARNLGLDNAKGEWITFVDADDWLDKDCLDLCSEKFMTCDFIRFGMLLYRNKIEDITIREVDEEYTKEKYLSDLLARNAILGVCGGIYRASLFDKIRFSPKYISGEDWLVQLQLLLNSKHPSFLNKPLYCYNKENEDSCTSVFRFRTHMSALQAMNEIAEISANYIPENEYSIVLAKAKCMLVYDFITSKIVARQKLLRTEMRQYRAEANFSKRDVRLGSHSLRERILLSIYRSYLGRLFF